MNTTSCTKTVFDSYQLHIFHSYTIQDTTPRGKGKPIKYRSNQLGLIYFKASYSTHSAPLQSQHYPIPPSPTERVYKKERLILKLNSNDGSRNQTNKLGRNNKF